MSQLPQDIARCAGSTLPQCQTCRRREPPAGPTQSYIRPEGRGLDCAYYIAPLPTRTQARAELAGGAA